MVGECPCQSFIKKYISTCHFSSTLSGDLQFTWKLVLKLLLQLVELGGVPSPTTEIKE